jgi:hypothetical protein
MNLSLRTQKADSFRFAPPSRKTGVLKAFLGYVRSSELIDSKWPEKGFETSSSLCMLSFR